MKRRKRTNSRTLDLFSGFGPAVSPTSAFRWPSTERFPLNADGQTVRGVVGKELLDATSVLVVTGYTSLDQVIDLIRPVWYAKLKERRRKPLLLRDIRDELMELEERLGSDVIDAFVEFPLLPPPDERISACIIGMP